MKRQIIFTCLLGFLISDFYAQEIRIKAIPYLMHFENAPAGHEIIGDNHIRFSAPGKTTDWWEGE